MKNFSITLKSAFGNFPFEIFSKKTHILIVAWLFSTFVHFFLYYGFEPSTMPWWYRHPSFLMCWGDERRRHFFTLLKIFLEKSTSNPGFPTRYIFRKFVKWNKYKKKTFKKVQGRWLVLCLLNWMIVKYLIKLIDHFSAAVKVYHSSSLVA